MPPPCRPTQSGASNRGGRVARREMRRRRGQLRRTTHSLPFLAQYPHGSLSRYRLRCGRCSPTPSETASAHPLACTAHSLATWSGGSSASRGSARCCSARPRRRGVSTPDAAVIGHRAALHAAASPPFAAAAGGTAAECIDTDPRGLEAWLPRSAVAHLASAVGCSPLRRSRAEDPRTVLSGCVAARPVTRRWTTPADAGGCETGATAGGRPAASGEPAPRRVLHQPRRRHPSRPASWSGCSPSRRLRRCSPQRWQRASPLPQRRLLRSLRRRLPCRWQTSRGRRRTRRLLQRRRRPRPRCRLP